jgi:pimeloyl-ACP methyl ester carboxylesterase
MDELAAQLLFVLSQFGLKSVIGLGVGAGANILARFAMQHPDKVIFAEEEKKTIFLHFHVPPHFQVGALCLVNCSSTATGWIEWGYQLMNARNLRTKGMTQGVLDYLMWHHFGHRPEERNMDLVHVSAITSREN